MAQARPFIVTFINTSLMLLLLFSISTLTLARSDKPYQLQTLSDGLEYPWSIAFLPNGDYLVSLRVGKLLRVSASGEILAELGNTPASYVAGQGGYFDIALDPAFDTNQKVYLAFAHGSPKQNATRVIQAELAETELKNVKTIFTVATSKDTPAHYGGKLQFISDGTLLLTTGDGFQCREKAQDKFSQLGKIIRMHSDGSVPADNPYADGKNGDPYVYSYGHRSPQGLAFDAANKIIYMHEHGPQGGDEVNIIQSGANYGWPATGYGVNYSGARVSPHTEYPGITDPAHYWVPSIAPSGLAFYDGDIFPQWQGSLFVGALVNKEVRRLELKDGKVVAEHALFSELGERIREVRQAPDGNLYLLTDSENGKVIRVSKPNN